ncbi:DUF4179 domain-containing protein [Haloimpatiens sp. FM7330]|uniref:DUF4179 domain-containing protein n=1 Tax=Haloimpatiens sp. FM7330 TaxID=3298610 RepID=UPI00363C0FF5
MNKNFSEDEILTLLNDVNISDNELSELNLSDVDKNNISKDVMKKIKHKNSKWKKIAAAASISGILLLSIPFISSNTFAKMMSKLTIISGIGEVKFDNKGMTLKESKTNNNITLNSMYIDKNKVIVMLSTNNKNKLCNFATLEDNKGNIYKIKLNEGMCKDNIRARKGNFKGNIKKSDKYTLTLGNSKNSFSLNSNDFKEVSEVKNLYTATNGVTTLNITSIKRDKDILKITYYVTDKIHPYKKHPVFKESLNKGTFESEKDAIKHGYKKFPPFPSNIAYPYFELIDEYGHRECGHDSAKPFVNENESLFNLKKLKGKKLKLSLLSVPYWYNSEKLKLTLDIPKQGKKTLNRIETFKGFKFTIISIERKSPHLIKLRYTPLDTNNPKLIPTQMNLDVANICECKGNILDDTNRPNKKVTEDTLYTKNNKDVIGDKLEIDGIIMRYSSVGPFEIEFDLDKINK